MLVARLGGLLASVTAIGERRVPAVRFGANL